MDDRLERKYQLKFADEFAAVESQLLEAKLTQAVAHAINVLYVKGPSTKPGSKERAGLVRQLAKRVQRAGIKLPAELQGKINDL